MTASYRTRVILSIVIGVILVSASVLIWALQTGRIGTKADVTAQPAYEPFYRLYNNATGEHFYTTNYDDEVAPLLNSNPNLVAEGLNLSGYIYKTQVTDTVPLYRYVYNDKDPVVTQRDKHFYTTDSGEFKANIMKDEGIAGYVYNYQEPGTSAVYRHYNESNGDHLYIFGNSADVTGYKNENVKWYAYTQPPANAPQPFYRLYNSATSEHFYTTAYDIEVVPLLNSNPNIVAEGLNLSGYIYTNQVAGTVPLYRYAYNDNDPVVAQRNKHFYTTNSGEYNATTMTYEGPAGYVYERPVTDTLPVYRHYNNANGDHLYIIGNSADVAGYKNENLGWYTYTQSLIPADIVVSKPSQPTVKVRQSAASDQPPCEAFSVDFSHGTVSNGDHATESIIRYISLVKDAHGVFQVYGYTDPWNKDASFGRVKYSSNPVNVTTTLVIGWAYWPLNQMDIATQTYYGNGDPIKHEAHVASADQWFLISTLAGDSKTKLIPPCMDRPESTPTNFTASIVENNKIQMTWTGGTLFNDHFEIWNYPNNAPKDILRDTQGNNPSINITGSSWTSGHLANGIYNLDISAKNYNDSNWSAPSNRQTVTINYTSPTPISTPTVTQTVTTPGPTETVTTTATATVTQTVTASPAVVTPPTNAPTNLSVSIQNQSDILLTWDYTAATDYAGFIVFDASNDGFVRYVGADQRSLLLEKMICDKDYSFYVAAVGFPNFIDNTDKFNISAKSNIISTKTETCTGDRDALSKQLQQALDELNKLKSSPSSLTKTGKLVSTGAALWFNILVALIVAGLVSFFILRRPKKQ